MDEQYESLPSDDASEAKEESFLVSTPRSSVHSSDIASSPLVLPTKQDRDADVSFIGGAAEEDSFCRVGMIHTIVKDYSLRTLGNHT
jgi:hypothetical protein